MIKEDIISIGRQGKKVSLMAAKIINVYKVGKDFVHRLADASSKSKGDERNKQMIDRLEAYKQTFIAIHPDCFSNGDPLLTPQLTALGMFDPFQEDPSELTNTIDKLDEFEGDIERIIIETIEKCQTEFPLKQDFPIWILPGGSTSDHLKKLNGLSAAYSKKSDGIRLVIYPINEWLERLPFVLAHEYHHLIYAIKRDMSSSLLDRVVAEGLADDFANRLFPNLGGPWTLSDFSFTYHDETTAYECLHGEIDEVSLLKKGGHNLYLVGQWPHADMTPYAGYAVAYRLVQGFVSSHDVSLTELLELDPKIILAESIYKPHAEE